MDQNYKDHIHQATLTTIYIYRMEDGVVVQKGLRPMHYLKNLRAMKAERAVKRITFDRTEATGETLYISVPKLNKNEVIVPGSLALVFNLKVSGHADNFLVQNVSRALVDKFVAKFSGTILRDTVGYDIYKIFEYLFLSEDERESKILEGIQSEDLCKIRSNAGNKKSLPAENKLNDVYGDKYRIRFDHEILTDHGVFYPEALYSDLIFELTLALAPQVVKGSDASKLNYRLTNIQQEYEMIRSEALADEADRVYKSGKEFAYDHVMREEVVTFKKDADQRLNIRANPQRRSLKAILLLFIEPYVGGARESEKYFNRHHQSERYSKRFAQHGLQGKDMRGEISRFFANQKRKSHMTLTKIYTDNKFGLLIDLRSMEDNTMHGSGTRLVNTKDGVHLETERKGSGSGNLKCHVYTISDTQMNIMNSQLESVQY